MKLLPVRWIAVSLLSAAGLASLSACVPLVVGGGAAGAVLVAVDRRTSGMQLEGQLIDYSYKLEQLTFDAAKTAAENAIRTHLMRTASRHARA